MQTCKLSPAALGLAIGVMWAFSLLIIGLLSYYADYGTTFIMTVNSLYFISGVTLANVFFTTIIGFVDGFIGGVILAFLYNLFGGNCCSTSDKDK